MKISFECYVKAILTVIEMNDQNYFSVAYRSGSICDFFKDIYGCGQITILSHAHK